MKHPASAGSRSRTRFNRQSEVSAFSLTEVMFAVIVLGIGFIMVAAMFPVSISQSRLTVEETSAAAIARSAMADASRLAENGDSPPTSPAPNTWGQLFPPTDLYKRPPTVVASQTTSLNAASFTVQAHQQVTVPGKVLSFYDPRLDDTTVKYRTNLWNAFKNSLIVPSDNRYAWIPLYRRDVTYFNNTDAAIDANSAANLNLLTPIQSPFVQLYLIPVAVRNRTQYNMSTGANNIDLTPPNLNDTNLLPRVVLVDVVPEASAVTGYIIRFAAPITSGSQTRDAAVEGAFVVISDDRIVQPRVAVNGVQVNVNQGRMNGRIFRLGIRRPDLDTTQAARNFQAWEISPGSEFARDPGANGRLYDPVTNPSDVDDIVAIGNTGNIANSHSNTRSNVPATAFIIGRNTLNSGTFAGSGAYEGPAQDVAAFVTFVKVN